jgi:hypothetical protein
MLETMISKIISRLLPIFSMDNIESKAKLG